MQKWIAILGLTVATSALADAALPPTDQTSASRSPQVCERYLAPGTARPTQAVATDVSLHLTDAGQVQNPTLFRSSGRDDLDKAALACVAKTRLPPIQRDGMPIAVDIVMAVAWLPNGSNVYPAGPSGSPALCDIRQMYPVQAVQDHEQGDVSVVVRIGETGAVKSMKVVKSSGYPLLDQASLDCTAKLQYFPVKQNGRGVEFDRQFAFRWAL